MWTSFSLTSTIRNFHPPQSHWFWLVSSLVWTCEILLSTLYTFFNPVYWYPSITNRKTTQATQIQQPVSISKQFEIDTLFICPNSLDTFHRCRGPLRVMNLIPIRDVRTHRVVRRLWGTHRPPGIVYHLAVLRPHPEHRPTLGMDDPRLLRPVLQFRLKDPTPWFPITGNQGLDLN